MTTDKTDSSATSSVATLHDGAALKRLGLRRAGDDPAVERRPVAVGLFSIFVFFGLFIGWAASASLTSAALAPGMVSVEGARKTVQHFEGGIVRAIHVSDGGSVTEGDVLLELDSTSADAELEILTRRRELAVARQARLVAERDGLEVLPDPIHESPQSFAEQRQLFADGLARHREMLTRQQARISQLEREIDAREKQRASRSRQLALVRAEMAELAALKSRGLVTRDKVYDLGQREAELVSDRSADDAGLASAREKIGEIQVTMSELANRRTTDAAEDLRRVRDELVEIDQNIRTAEGVLSRTLVRAPSTGTVIDAQVHTVGGVIKPGEPLMSIVPAGARLLIEAKVRAQDRDVVDAGLRAEVRFTAFSQRTTRPVPGTVLFVSADSMVDQPGTEPFYLARIELAEAAQIELQGRTLHPGMQADVTIISGNRTPLDYMLQPIGRIFSRALKDQ